MKIVRHAPLRRDEFTKDQWFDRAREAEPWLTRAEFDMKWPAFCRFLEHIQNAQIMQVRHDA